MAPVVEGGRDTLAPGTQVRVWSLGPLLGEMLGVAVEGFNLPPHLVVVGPRTLRHLFRLNQHACLSLLNHKGG